MLTFDLTWIDGDIGQCVLSRKRFLSGQAVVKLGSATSTLLASFILIFLFLCQNTPDCCPSLTSLWLLRLPPTFQKHAAVDRHSAAFPLSRTSTAAQPPSTAACPPMLRMYMLKESSEERKQSSSGV